MSKSQVMCVGCDNPAGKQDAESDGFCEECIAFATDRVTPVAAQAGDEPMRLVSANLLDRAVTLLQSSGQMGVAHQLKECVSPRATADVERDKAVCDLVRLWDSESVSADDYNEEMCRIEAIIRATTKPGA